MRRQLEMSRIEMGAAMGIMVPLLLLIVPSLGNIRDTTRRTWWPSLRLTGRSIDGRRGAQPMRR